MKMIMLAVFSVLALLSGLCTIASPASAVTLNCVSAPSSCGYPDSTNSGVPAGTALENVPTYHTSGPGWTWVGYPLDCVVITQPGAVVSGLYVDNGCIEVKADNVTVTGNKVFEEGNSWGIGILHANGTVIQGNTVYGGGDTHGMSPDNNRLQVGVKDVYGDSTGTNVTGNSFYDIGAGVQISAGTIQGNYLRDFNYACQGVDAGTDNCGTPAQCTPSTCDHVDGIVSDAGTAAGLLIQDNTVLVSLDQTGAITLFEDFGNQENDTVTGNLIAGGGWTVDGGCGDHGGTTTPVNMVFTNNRFSSIYYPDSGGYGTNAGVCVNPAYNEVWSGNFWDTTGASVPADS